MSCGKEDVHTSAWVVKIQYKVCKFGLNWRDSLASQATGRDPLVAQVKGETRWSLKQTCQILVRVLRPPNYFTKRVPATEERYVRTLSDCVPTYTQSSPSKNKNINYMCIYLRVLHCLSSSAICDPMKSYSTFTTAPGQELLH